MTDLKQLRREIIKKDFARMNPMQLDAVIKIRGPVLILAGAGSGKTTVLVNRIANMVKYGDAYYSDFLPDMSGSDIKQAERYLENPTGAVPYGVAVHPVKPWNILAITFTNKAAAELKERIVAKLGEAGGEIAAGTFHSTCAKILRRYADRLGYSSRFTIYDTDDQKRLMKDVYKQLNIDDKTLPIRAALNGISNAKDSLIMPADYQGGSVDYMKKQIGRIYELYSRLLKTADAMDFDDLLVNTVRLFRENPDVLEYYQNRFSYIMVDEYQDTNHAQYIFVKLLAEKHRNICVVGDDDQSIYRFRGATIENILNFEKEYKDARVIRLEQNYRSTKTILDAANAVIKSNTARKGKNLWTENDSGSNITVYTADDEREEARYIADRILENIRNGQSFSSHAVLYRTNAQSNAIENVFARSGISYRVIGGFRFFERKEIRDVLAYLHIINNPSDSVRLRRIINEPKRAIGDTTVAALAEIADGVGISMFEAAKNAADYPSVSRAAGKLAAFCDMIEELQHAAETVSLHELLELTLDKSGYMASLISQGNEAADRVDNVNELSSSIVQYEEENDEPSLEGFLEEIALVSDIDSLDDDDKTVLMTLHSAKGLEFDNVFIAGMEEGIFPGNQSIYGGPEEIEEERRLAYVGITRAKKTLVITHTNSRMLYGSTTRNRVSRFLTEIPDDLLKKEGRKPYARMQEGAGWKAGETGFDRGSSAFGDFSAEARAKAAYSAHTASSAEPQPATLYSPGMRVKHKAFGEGKVVKCTPMGKDTLVEIIFDSAGMKKLMSNFAKLDIVE